MPLRVLLALSLGIVAFGGLSVGASTERGTSRALPRLNAKAGKPKPLANAGKKAPEGARRAKQRKSVTKHSKPRLSDGPPSVGSINEASALSKKGSKKKTRRSPSAKQCSTEHAPMSEPELDEPACNYLLRQRRSNQHVSRKDPKAASDDNWWIDKFSEAGAAIEKMVLELNGPYFVGAPLKLVPDKKFKPLDRQFSGLLPKIAKWKSAKKLGIKTTTSLVPRELISFGGVQLSGDRVITTRHTVSTTPDKRREYAIEVYDVVTDAVMFSIKHVTENTVVKLDATGRLLVVIEHVEHAQRSVATVYERINATTIETSTASLPVLIGWTKISADSSKIVFGRPPDDKHSIVFLKGKGYLAIHASDVGFGDNWIACYLNSLAEIGCALVAINTVTGAARRLFSSLETVATLSKDILIWPEEHRDVYVIKMLDLNQGDFTLQEVAAMPENSFRLPTLYTFGDFEKTRSLVVADFIDGSFGLLNVGLGAYFFSACPTIAWIGRRIPLLASHDSPLLLRSDDSFKADYSIIHLKSSSVPDYDLVWHAKACTVVKEKVTATAVQTHLFQYIPLPVSRPRLTTMSVGYGSLYTFDGDLRYRYNVPDAYCVMHDSWVIYRSTVNGNDARGSVELPASLAKGIPQHLQTNLDGTVFYVAAVKDRRSYIYVIDVASKEVYGYRLKHLESDIVEMKAHLGGKALEVVTRNKVVLVFSWSNQRLRLRNKLVEGEQIVDVSQSIVVFEEGKAAGWAIGYFDITKTGADLYSLPYRKAGFVAVDKDDIYLTNTKSTLRFNVKTKETATIERHYEGHYYVRSSQVDDGRIRIIDWGFVYRVLDIKTLRQLYEIRLPLTMWQAELHMTISSDGQRVMALNADKAHLLEIGDPELMYKTQTIRKLASARPVEQLQVF